MYPIARIKEIVNGVFIQHAADCMIENLAIDSRKISFPGQTLFFAISTPQRDGHQYLEQAYVKGVRNFLVTRKTGFPVYTDANYLLAGNSIEALQQLAAYHRNRFQFPVIGITGSNGKTIVKEWLFRMLHHEFNIVRSPKSYNSQIGVPLSIWNMQPTNNLAIFEAGISTTNEMENLERMIRPDIGILTNIGTAHNEGFENNIEKLKEKLKLFAHSSLLIYCNNNPPINEIIGRQTIKKMTWGKTRADVLVSDLTKQNGNLQFSLLYQNQLGKFSIHFTDEAAFENAMCCICLLLHFGYSYEKIGLLLKQLEPVAMRLEQKKGIGNSLLINDSYSNDLSSLQIALDYLEQQNPALPKTVVLTDFLQPEPEKEKGYKTVADLLQQKKIKKLIGIGSDMHRYQYFFNRITAAKFYLNAGELIENFDPSEFANQVILIKGARKFGLEKFAVLLEEKVHQTVLEIQLDKVLENIKRHVGRLDPVTRVMAIVKAFGYGSGAAEVATVLQNGKISYLAVAYADEGVTLRKAGIHLPIMVMNTDEAAFETLVEYGLEPEIFSFGLLRRFLHFAAKNALLHYPIHLKLETGMHRLGFEESEIPELAQVLKNNTLVQVITVFSHLVGSEDPALDAFTQQQNEIFIRCCNMLEKDLGYHFVKHIANSAAIERHPYLQHDMVRLGIGMYGVIAAGNLPLQQVCTLKTTIAQIKTVRPGDTVGYNRKGTVHRESRIATVRIGYADGYNRLLGNGNGKMLVNGKFAATIGSICMDMTMIDITGIPNVEEEDYVTVFGDEIPVQDLAKACNTIPYEILTGISQRVKRIYYGD